MSSRRSGRAKAPVKYTSDYDESDFGNKKRTKSASKAAPKKRTKAEADATADTSTTPKKRAKKDHEVLAAEYSAKAQAQEEKAQKAQHKKAWEAWLEKHDVDGQLLDDEPEREESITQTDSLKKYGLKKEELSSLKHFEKKNPLYNNMIKLFLEEEVKKLAFRKYGMLDGAEKEDEILKAGEKIWKEEHKNDVEAMEKQKNGTPKKTDKPVKAKTSKQKWTAYVETHSVSEEAALKEEPEDAINQSNCKTEFGLTPGDLVALPYFPKPNPKYGNTTKLFNESEVKGLAYRKHAMLAGVEEDDDAKLLEKGKELFEEEK